MRHSIERRSVREDEILRDVIRVVLVAEPESSECFSGAGGTEAKDAALLLRKEDCGGVKGQKALPEQKRGGEIKEHVTQCVKVHHTHPNGVQIGLPDGQVHLRLVFDEQGEAQ